MNEIAIFIANYFIAIPIIAAIIVFFTLKSRSERISYAFVMIGGGILAILLAKLGAALWYDPRPFVIEHFTPLIPHAADNGFPSDHTLLAAFIGWTTLRYSFKTGIAVLIVAALIGAARVYTGVHHTADIIGSFVISGIAVLIVMAALRYSRSKEHTLAQK